MHPLIILQVVMNLGLVGSPPFDVRPKPIEKKGCYRVQKGERVTFEVTCFTVTLKTIIFSVGTKCGKVTLIIHISGWAFQWHAQNSPIPITPNYCD